MAAALGLGALLGLLGLLGAPGGATKVLHSLWYLNVAVLKPSPGIPQFTSMGFLDGIPFVRYDSERGRMEPQTPWMENGAEPGFWDRQTEINKRNQHVAAANLETQQGRYNQSGGVHTRQQVSGCDLLSDGTVRGSFRIGYDGRDFISFELGSKSFVAADGAAQVTKRRWETEGIEAERRTNYLEHICPEWLRKYVGYGREALERKEPPDVHVSGKEEHGILTLSCHAYGFYPGIIGISWMKGDEIRDQETEWGGVVPNSDGTFHSWARIEALPGEWEQYRCRVEHAGMPEPGIFAWEPESNWNSTPVVVALSVIAAIIFISLMGFGVWKLQSGKRERNGYNTTEQMLEPKAPLQIWSGTQELPPEQSVELDPAPSLFLRKARSCWQSSSHCSHPPWHPPASSQCINFLLFHG
ncbi:class I histocompatibility antigen, F10 alpha chain-like [Pithys albifrons albifrons]|uniref:class I histocompatibility antigen, F10 alpha chain-like n=1 Tax=Pithys albifrons albifrons TaxID=3385563 RepID=UPI003A5D152C